MAAGRTCCILRLFVVVLLHGALLKENAQFVKLSLQCMPRLMKTSGRAALLKTPALLQSSHGISVLTLPFDSRVPLAAYFALCCDVSPNPGPTIRQTYSRAQLLEVGNSAVYFKSQLDIDLKSIAILKRNGIFANPPWLTDILCRSTYEEQHSITTRISQDRRRKSCIRVRNIANFIDCSPSCSSHVNLHTSELQVGIKTMADTYLHGSHHATIAIIQSWAVGFVVILIVLPGAVGRRLI